MSRSNVLFVTLLAVVLLGLMAKYVYQKPKFILGEQAPNFETTLISGEKKSLADLRGRVVLLQFWGSWCGPCRAENPHLAELFRKFSGRGFDIFSIAVEQNEARWKNAIEKDGLVWPFHAVEMSEDLQFFKGKIVEQYQVRSIPQTYLLDKNGTIVGINLSPTELEKAIEKRLN